MKPATWITKEIWFYLLCSKVNVPICPQSDIHKTQKFWKRGRDLTTLESLIHGVCLLPFPPFLPILHKGRQVPPHCSNTESLVQHGQPGFDMQVQFECDFERRLLAPYPCRR